MKTLPDSLRWVLWDLDFEQLDPDAHADSILARVLEHGRLADVHVLLALYGADRIHRFFRAGAHPVIGARTRAFWRAYFHAEDESWPTSQSWRRSSAAPWID